MARKRAFNSREVLADAAEVFARFGYAGTSVDQLVEATNLQRGSIYQAFASKAGLFRTSLERQVDILLAERPTDNSLVTDLIIVAMWERANIDKEVARLVERALPILAQCENKNIERILFERLARRVHEAVTT